MPELPEVETIRLALDGRLVGRTITRARLHRRDMLVMPGDPPGGFSRSCGESTPKRVRRADLLEGAVVVRTLRHGKQLAIVADNARVLCIHLGMSGQLLLTSPKPRSQSLTHTHADWTFDDGVRLIFRDPRRFGGLWSFPSVQALLSARWNALGPDGLSLSARQLREALAGVRRPVKGALLDQARIAGVGNIYADEALFAAGISPGRPCDAVTNAEATALAREIRSILRRAIKAGGSSLRDHRTPDGDPGSFQLAHKVYGRAGQPCPRCHALLISEQLAQRTTVSCPACQR